MRYHYLNIIFYNTIFNNLKENTIYYEANEWIYYSLLGGKMFPSSLLTKLKENIGNDG